MPVELEAEVDAAATRATAVQQELLPTAKLTVANLAALFRLNKEALRKRLERWRKQNDKGWTENPDGTSREPKILYEVRAVMHVIKDMQRGQRTSIDNNSRQTSPSSGE